MIIPTYVDGAREISVLHTHQNLSEWQRTKTTTMPTRMAVGFSVRHLNGTALRRNIEGEMRGCTEMIIRLEFKQIA